MSWFDPGASRLYQARKNSRKEHSLPSAENKWILLLNGSSGVHLECPWNYAFFPYQGDWCCWKSCVGPMKNTSSTDKILHVLFCFLSIWSFICISYNQELCCTSVPTVFLEFQWSLSRQKFSRTVFKGKGNFSLSEKHCILQPLKWRKWSFLKKYTCLKEYLQNTSN